MLRNTIVDLTTKSKILENLMLIKYPGLLYKWQIEKSGEGENKKYTFRNLDYGELNLFLNGKNVDFIIYESETKRVIENNQNFNKQTYLH